MNQEIDTFESICAGRGEPIEVFDIISPPERDIRCGKFIPSPDPVRVGIWKLPDDIEGGLMVCGTYHTGAPFQWHYNCGERSAVAHLLADRDRLRAELDAVAKERSGPHCLRCRNAAVCSTRDGSIPLCVTDPEGNERGAQPEGDEMSVCANCEGTGMVRANRMVSGKYQFRKIPCSCKKGMAKEIAILRDEKSTLLAALEKAVERYGKPGGPWNVPSEPGTWIADARAAISKAKGVGA